MLNKCQLLYKSCFSQTHRTKRNSSCDCCFPLVHAPTHLFFLYIYIYYLPAVGLGCGMWDLVPWPGIEPEPPALGVWSLSHWTTREVLPAHLLNESPSFSWHHSWWPSKHLPKSCSDPPQRKTKFRPCGISSPITGSCAHSYFPEPSLSVRGRIGCSGNSQWHSRPLTWTLNSTFRKPWLLL